MSKHVWTDEDIAILLANPRDNAYVAAEIGISEAAVRGKRQRLDGKATAAKVGFASLVVSTLEDDKARSTDAHWHRQYKTLSTKYERLLRESTATQQLVEAAKDLAPRSYTSAPAIIRKDKGTGKPQSAVLMLSDTHVGAVIKPTQTLGFGDYNFQIFLDRLKFLENAVFSILEDHTTTKVPELVICLGGDMLHGALNHSAEAGQVNTLFQQYYGAGHALAQFIRNLAPLVPSVRIYGVAGNHPRWQNQHRMPTDNRYSNLDSFLYAYVAALTREVINVQWNLDAQPFALFDVQGFRFHLSHGDQLRGGDKALGIPNHSVGRMVSSSTQLFNKHSQVTPHYYLVGHLHRGIVLPHAKGSVIINGGFPGVDGFGLMEGFSPVDPTQVFFLVHPRYGKTATYEIQLKHATPGADYRIPECGEPIQ